MNARGAQRIAANAGRLIELMRVQHWSKNLLCFAGILFTVEPLSRASITGAVWTFMAFCFASSAVYILNDIADAERDRLHPRKCARPIASGRVAVSHATWLGLVLMGGGVAYALQTQVAVVACVVAYVIINISYSRALKTIALSDVFCIATGFLLRLIAGIYAVPDIPTAWIVICAFCLSLFLGFAKRRAELAAAVVPASQRPVLAHYSVEYLDFLVSATSTMSVVSYMVFTTTSGRDPTLLLTALPVIYAVFHYKRITMLATGAEEPESILLTDNVIRICITVWLLGFFVITSYQPGIFR